MKAQRRELEPVHARTLTEGPAPPPHQFVVWNGASFPLQELSVNSRLLPLLDTSGEAPPRELVLKAARLEDTRGIPPDAVRPAIRMHQRATPVTHLLLRQIGDSGFVTVVELCAGVSRRLPPGSPIPCVAAEPGTCRSRRAIGQEGAR